MGRHSTAIEGRGTPLDCGRRFSLFARFIEVTRQDELHHTMIGAGTQSETEARLNGERRAAVVEHREELMGLHVVAVEVLQRSEVVVLLRGNCPGF